MRPAFGSRSLAAPSTASCVECPNVSLQPPSIIKRERIRRGSPRIRIIKTTKARWARHQACPAHPQSSMMPWQRTEAPRARGREGKCTERATGCCDWVALLCSIRWSEPARTRLSNMSPRQARSWSSQFRASWASRLWPVDLSATVLRPSLSL